MLLGVLSMSFAPQKSNCISKTTTQAGKKQASLAVLPARLEYDLRFERYDESVYVYLCNGNLNKKNTHPSILDIGNVGPNRTDNVWTHILFKILFDFVYIGQQCYQSLLS